MPKVGTVLDEPRTRTIKTETTETVPVKDSTGLGKPPIDWLREAPDDELALAEVSIYRNEPTRDGLLVKLGGNLGGAPNPNPIERVDEAWIQSKFGGGVYGVKVYVKSIGQGFDGRVVADGPVKPNPFRAAPQPASVSPPSGSVDSALGEQLRRQNDLIESLIERTLDARTAQAGGTGADVMNAAMNVAKQAVELSGSRVGAPPGTSGRSPIEEKLLTVALERLLAPTTPASNPLMDKLLQTAIDRLLAPPPGPAKTLKDQIEEMRALRELIDSGGGKGDIWSTLVEKGIDKIPDLVNGVTGILDKRLQYVREVNAAQAAAAGARPNLTVLPGRPAPPPTPGMVPQAPANAPASGEIHVRPIGQAPAVESPATAEAAGSAAEIVENYLKMRIVAMVQEAAGGDNLVTAVDAMRPDLGSLLTHLAKMPDGRQRIVAFFEGDPILQAAVADPNFAATIDEAIAYMRESVDADRAN